MLPLSCVPGARYFPSLVCVVFAYNAADGLSIRFEGPAGCIGEARVGFPCGWILREPWRCRVYRACPRRLLVKCEVVVALVAWVPCRVPPVGQRRVVVTAYLGLTSASSEDDPEPGGDRIKIVALWQRGCSWVYFRGAILWHSRWLGRGGVQ